MASRDESSLERARAHFARIGEYKRASHRKALEEHLELSVEERLQRSWEFYEMYEGCPTMPVEPGALEFYALCRRLGVCCDGS
jgi:hypothetical protein